MQEFDKLVRSMMENGREEVPAGLWDAVQSQLPAAAPAKTQRKAIVLTWTRRVGIALAAAAALTFGIVYSGRRPSSDQIEIVSGARNMVADVEEESIFVDEMVADFVPNEVPGEPVKILRPRRVDSSKATSTNKNSQTKDLEKAAATEAVPQQKAVSTEKANDKTTSSEKVEEKTVTTEKVTEKTSDTKALDRMEFEDSFKANAKKRKSSVYFSGNASSNTNPASKGPNGIMRVPAAAPSATGITETGESTFMIPVSFGTGIKFPLGERWSIGLGVNATYLGRTYAGTYREYDESGMLLKSETYSDIRNNQFYVGIPVNAYFSIVSNRFVDFYVYGGGSAEKCVYNNNIMQSPGGNTYFKGQKGGVMFSAGLGLGCEFMVADHLGIYIDPSARYYFKGKNMPKSVRTQQPFMAGIELGLRVKL